MLKKCSLWGIKMRLYHLLSWGKYLCLMMPMAYAETSFSPQITNLAASCFACHGPQGNSLGGIAALAGLNASDFNARMQGFKSGQVPATVMHHHAKGLTDEEILQLANYFAAMPPKTPPSLPRQPFKGDNHD